MLSQLITDEAKPGSRKKWFFYLLFHLFKKNRLMAACGFDVDL